METIIHFKDMGDFLCQLSSLRRDSMFLHAHAKWYEVDKLKRQGLLLGCGNRFWVKMDEYGKK